MPPVGSRGRKGLQAMTDQRDGGCWPSLFLKAGLIFTSPGFGALLWVVGDAHGGGRELGFVVADLPVLGWFVQAGHLPGVGFSLLPKAGKGADLVFWVLWRLPLACQEGKGAI